MALCGRFVTVAVVGAGLAIVPAAHAEHWHGGGHYYHHRGSNAAGAARSAIIAAEARRWDRVCVIGAFPD